MKMTWIRSAIYFAFLFAGVAHADLPPQVGSMAPAFALPDAGGTKRELADWKGRWVVLYFYPKDNTPGCTTEAISFRDNLPKFVALNAQVVGVSLDKGDSHRAFSDELHLPFPLLSDAGGEVARRYGALSDWGVLKFARRYTFLIDPDGRVAKSYQQVDAAKHAGEIISDLHALTVK